MTMKNIFVILFAIFIQMISVVNLYAGQKDAEYLDKIINDENITYYEYVRSDKYRRDKDVIREGLVYRLNEIIKNKYCGGHLLDYLLFVDDIADPRYIQLMATIEKICPDHDATAINIVGQSKYLKLKISKASKDEMLKLLNPKMGDRLMTPISEYIMSQCVSFDEKLKYFKLISKKADFANQGGLAGYTLDDIFNSLCVENPKATNAFIKNNGSFLHNINCDNIKEEMP